MKDAVDWNRKAGEKHAAKLAKFNRDSHAVTNKDQLKKVGAVALFFRVKHYQYAVRSSPSTFCLDVVVDSAHEACHQRL